MTKKHSWASAFRHLVSLSGAGAFLYRTGSPYPGTGLEVLASAFLLISVPDWPDAGQSGILKKRTPYVHTESDGMGYTLHVHTAGGGKKGVPPSRSYCWWWTGIHPEHPNFYISIFLAVERGAPCVFTLLAAEMDTPWMSLLLAVSLSLFSGNTVFAIF